MLVHEWWLSRSRDRGRIVWLVGNIPHTCLGCDGRARGGKERMGLRVHGECVETECIYSYQRARVDRMVSGEREWVGGRGYIAHKVRVYEVGSYVIIGRTQLG